MILEKNLSEKEDFEKINEWLKIYHTSSDIKEKDVAKARIVTQMVTIVRKIARTIARRSYDPIEDMIQAGFIGLLKAIDKYSPEKNDNFRVYAGYLIIGEIKHYLRDKLNTIRVPRYIQELSIRINNFTKDLTAEEVNKLTSEDVAQALDTTISSVNLAMQSDRRSSVVYLDDVYSTDSDTLSFEELLADDNYESRADYNDAKIIFNDIMRKLPPDERILIDMYYKQDMNKREIARALMISPMSVTRRMKQTFNTISSMIIDTSEQREMQKGNLNNKDNLG